MRAQTAGKYKRLQMCASSRIEWIRELLAPNHLAAELHPHLCDGANEGFFFFLFYEKGIILMCIMGESPHTLRSRLQTRSLLFPLSVNWDWWRPGIEAPLWIQGTNESWPVVRRPLHHPICSENIFLFRLPPANNRQGHTKIFTQFICSWPYFKFKKRR